MDNRTKELPIPLMILGGIGFSVVIFLIGWMMTSFAHSLKEGAIAAETAYKDAELEKSANQAKRCHSLGGSVMFDHRFLFKECIVTVTPK